MLNLSCCKQLLYISTVLQGLSFNIHFKDTSLGNVIKRAFNWQTCLMFPEVSRKSLLYTGNDSVSVRFVLSHGISAHMFRSYGNLFTVFVLYVVSLFI